MPTTRGRGSITFGEILGGLLGGLLVLGVAGFVLYLDFRKDAPPAGYTIKGNISVATGAKLYHVPGMRDYDITVIDTSKGERWFRTEAEAIAAGWRKAGPQAG